jgi:NAD(P)-dependent dehydrogenase (short-subunit alcohol dehydrogenase family)
VTRIAIVTGAASGIGLALSSALSQRGDTVIMADVNGERVTAECERLSRPNVVPQALDVRDSAAVNNLVLDVSGRYGRLDLMFNNAGIYLGGETDELLPAHWDRIIDVNLRGVVNGVSAAYPIMVKQGFGHIVNTASLAGLLPTALVAPYVTTKHAVVGLSLCLRAEAAAHGVRVTVICPGFVDTPFFDNGLPSDLPRSRLYKARQAKQHADKSRLAEFVLKHSNVYAPKQLADDILKGVARNKAVVVRPTSAQLQWLAVRLAPRAVDRIQTRIVKSMLKSLPD